MPRIMPRDDPEAYLEAFERMATGVGWDKAKVAYQLGTLLIDKAQAASRELSWKEAGDYQTVKAVILYQLEVPTENYRLRFQEKTMSNEK